MAKAQEHFFVGCFLSSKFHVQAAGFEFDEKVQHVSSKFCLDLFKVYSKRI